MRFNFGGGIADWTLAFGDTVTIGAPGAEMDGQFVVAVGDQQIRFFTDEQTGDQYDDLLGPDGSPTSLIVSEDGTGFRALGQIPPFKGPDNIKRMWAQAGDDGPRALMVTTDAADATGDVGTILPPLSVSGLLTVGTGQHRLYNDTTSVLTVAAVRASLGTPGTTETRIDINRNGTTIFPVQAEMLIFAAGQNTTGRVVPSEPPQLVPDDYITVDVDAAGTGARDLVVQLLAMRG